MFRISLIILILAGCSGGGSSSSNDIHVEESTRNTYLITGQSNALGFDWGYFEDRTGAATTNIAESGRGIDYLIDTLDVESFNGDDLNGIIFIHGEYDATYLTGLDYYISRVEEYRQTISIEAGKDLPLLISSVGQPVAYPVGSESKYSHLRDAVRQEAKINSNWVIVFDDAEHYVTWGMLRDHVHTNEQGSTLLMDTFAEYVNK